MKKADIGDIVFVDYPEAEGWDGEGRVIRKYLDTDIQEYIYVINFDRVSRHTGGFESEFITNISRMEIWDLEI